MRRSAARETPAWCAGNAANPDQHRENAEPQQMLVAKMKLDRERMDLQQAYTKKIAKAVPAIKAVRYAQVESRIDNELQRKVMLLIPLAP
jgi:hypothetical protein